MKHFNAICPVRSPCLTMLIIIVIIAGCSATAIEKVGEDIVTLDDKTNSVLTTVEIGSVILHKLAELHKAGVDKKILDEVQDAMLQVHEIVEKHHKEYVKQK